MIETADVIVVGAGVQGASLAFHLARRGARVVVLERSAVAAGATGRSSGFVRMHYDLESDARLAWVSFPYFEHWPELVGAGDCAFVRTGFLHVMPDDMVASLLANIAILQAIGIDTRVAERDEVARLIPGAVVDDIGGAAWEPQSGYADPSGTAAGFLEAARRLGTRYVQGCRVDTVTVQGDRVAGVETDRGRFAAPIVVDAAGAWAGQVSRMVGVEIPLTVWRHDTGYVGVPVSVTRPIPVVIDNARDMYFRPEGGELLLIGLEDENVIGGSPDRDTGDPEPDFWDKVTDRITSRIPGLVEGTFRAAHAGQDGLTPDQRSILGPAGPDGFYLDCGHSGTGFKTAPAIGLGMAELILDGAATSADISPFTPTRFAEGRLLEGEHGGRPIWR